MNPPSPHTHTLSLHDALPIFHPQSKDTGTSPESPRLFSFLWPLRRSLRVFLLFSGSRILLHPKSLRSLTPNPHRLLRSVRPRPLLQQLSASLKPPDPRSIRLS